MKIKDFQQKTHMFLANRKRTMELGAQILWVIFSRIGVSKTLISDNAPEFCDVGSCTWLRKIGFTPHRTPLYQPQSNGNAERMVRTVKMGLKAFEPYRDSIETYLPKFLMSYRSIPHAGKVQSPSALMGRQIRTSITMSFTTNEMWYKKKKARKLTQRKPILLCQKEIT